MNVNKNKTELKPSLSVSLLALYGIGAILGAGIYVLISEVASKAGYLTPFAFLLASVVALFTGFTYAELSSRFPLSAGEAVYVKKAFNNRRLSQLVGYLVVFTGIVSAATLTVGVVGYCQEFFHLHEAIYIIGFVVVLTLFAVWGIKQSAWAVALITAIEILGLLFIVMSADSQEIIQWFEIVSTQTLNASSLSGIALGGFLAFYAFIGFEDMVNVAEEVKDPKRNIPIAIFIALAVTTLLYMLVALVVVSKVPLQELASHKAPLALVVSRQGYSPLLISGIGLIAIINGALVQIIMASRVLYGLAKMGNAPSIFVRISKKTATPIEATLIVSVLVLVLAFWFPLVTLAQATSFIVLLIFLLVNSALIRIKLLDRKNNTTASAYVNFPLVMPVIGVCLCAAMLLMQLI